MNMNVLNKYCEIAAFTFRFLKYLQVEIMSCEWKGQRGFKGSQLI